jgi:hypothetical protein
VWVYTPNAGAIVSHSGAQTTFDNTGNMQSRQYVRRPDQGVFSYMTGATYSLSPTTILNYQFAVSEGHNLGGQDFATTNFNGPDVTFGLSEANPYRPKLSPVDGTNIYNPASYSISNLVVARSGAAVLTVTCWVAEPTCKTGSTLALCPTWSSISGMDVVSNPVRVTVIE